MNLAMSASTESLAVAFTQTTDLFRDVLSLVLIGSSFR